MIGDALKKYCLNSGHPPIIVQRIFQYEVCMQCNDQGLVMYSFQLI